MVVSVYSSVNTERQLSPSVCSPSKSKRRLDYVEGHDDITTDPHLENLCRKKFKPIAPKPTVKKDHHQSVVTATVPIKDVSQSDLSSFCVTKGNSKNGAAMFVSPKVQLIPSLPIITHAPPVNGDKFPTNSSMALPLFPHGKYVNVMTPPARVSLTDVAGHYKTIVQLLPNGTSNSSIPTADGSVYRTSNEIRASKPVPTRNEHSVQKCTNGTSGNKITCPSTKTKSVSKPKAGKYKYSLLMNGGSCDGAALNSAATNQTFQPCVTPAVSLNGGVRLNLPAVLTSSGILQITVPSVGIANGQVQFCDGLQPFDTMHMRSSVAQMITTQSVCTSNVATIATPQAVYSPNIATCNVLTPESINSDSHESDSQTNIDKTNVLNTSGMSLDETLRAMLKSPRATPSNDRQKETLQTKKTKPHRTSGSAARSQHKGSKTQSVTSCAPSVSVYSSTSEQSSVRSGIVTTRSSQDAERSPSYTTQGVHRPLPSRYTTEQSSIHAGMAAIGQNVQYETSVNSDNTRIEQNVPGSEVNHRSSGTRHSNYLANSDTVSLVPLAMDPNRTGTETPDLSSRLVVSSAAASISSTASINNEATSMPVYTSQTGGQNRNHSRQSLPSMCVTTSSTLHRVGRVTNDLWSRTDHIAPRAASLPNFATGSRGIPTIATTTTTTTLIAFNIPTNHVSQQRALSNVSLPSPMRFEQDLVRSHRDTTPVLSTSSVMPPMQSQQSQQTTNSAITTANFASLTESVTSSSSLTSRPVFNSSNNVIVRNSHSHPHGSSSSLQSVEGVLPRSAIQSGNEIIRPHGQGANSCTAVTYIHNTLTSVHSADHGYPTLADGPCNSNIPTLPTPSIQHGTYFSEVDRSGRPPIPPEIRGASIREDREMVSARRQLQLLDETPRNPPPHVDGEILNEGHNQPNNELPAVISRQNNQESAVQRQSVDASVLRPDILETTTLPTRNTEPSLFSPPTTIVPHHAGILATAILRSRALERNPWGMSPLNVSTAFTASNNVPSTTTTTIPLTTAGYSGVTICSSHATNLANGTSMVHSHHLGDVLHLRSAPGMSTSLGRTADKDSHSWPTPAEGIPNMREEDNLAGGHASQLSLVRQRRMAALTVGLTGVRNAEIEQSGPIPAITSGEQLQNTDGHVQSVPLHSNISATARNAMNEALQRKTRTPRIQPRRCTTPASVVSTHSHTSSGVVTSNPGCISSIEAHPQLGTERQTMITSDSQLGMMGQPRHSLPHQHAAHHIHSMPGSRLPSDSVSHLPMPLMPPPSVLYGSSTPVPNLSMTPLHGVPLPGALSGHSMQGHHQLHATPPPVPHHGQSTGPNPQGTVNHMFVSTPYGPIHRSLYMPPPSPHPPDLSLMSPRSYGQVHMHDSVLYSPRFSSPLRNLQTSNLTEGMFGSTLPRSFSDDRLDTCCSVPYAHSPPIHDNSSHMFPPGFMSPSMSRNQPSLQTSLCNTHQRSFNHHGHQNMPERLPNPFFHEGMRHPSPHQLHTSAVPTSSFASPPSTTAMTNVCSALDTSVPVSAVSSCNPTHPISVGSSVLVNALSPAMSSTAAATPGSTISSRWQ